MLGGGYTDIGLLDAHILTVDWGDSTVSTFAISAILTPNSGLTLASGNSFSSSTDGGTLYVDSIDVITGEVRYAILHSYAAAGEVTVKISVVDDDGGVGSSNSVTLTIPSDIILL
jgi:hypothetical protein